MRGMSSPPMVKVTVVPLPFSQREAPQLLRLELHPGPGDELIQPLQ